MPGKSSPSPQSTRPRQLPPDVADSELFGKIGEDNPDAEVQAEPQTENLLSQEWRWSRGQFADSASLVTVHGGAKAIMGLAVFPLRGGRRGTGWDIGVRNPCGNGILDPIQFDHPVARAIVAVPELLTAVIATMETRLHWQECEACADGDPCDLGESLDNFCSYVNQHAHARAIHGKPLPKGFEEHVASCRVVIEQARIDWDIKIAREGDTV